MLAALLPTAGCSGVGLGDGASTVHDFEPPSSVERYCAWYGDARDGVLYFGQAAFWSAMRGRGGNPLADLEIAGPVPVGRFDLARERPLESLEVGAAADRSGVWDVHAHPNGRVYFTTFFGSAGYVDPATGEVVRLPALGGGLNELAPGPGGGLLATRYGGVSGSDGAVLVLDRDGGLVGEFPLRAPPGYRVAPKTAAYDPRRGEIWVTTDLLSEAGEENRHDAYLLDARGAELRRIDEPEIQFVVFGEDGTGYRAEVKGSKLWLQVTEPGGGPESGRRIRLDSAFVPTVDFVQDIQLAAGGRAVVTRWSGWIHLVEPSGEVHSQRFPTLAEGGLYYTAVLSGDRICATHCAGVSVVCRAAR